MKLIALIIAILFGGALGVLLGFYIPFFACQVIDFVAKPETGEGWGAVGWLICIVTVPVGAIIGGSFGFLFALNPHKYIKRKIHLETPLFGKNVRRFDQNGKHQK